MHERNPYKIPPDFDSLARAYPLLRPQSVLILPFFSSHRHTFTHSIIRTSDNGPPTIDFQDGTAQRSLESPFFFHLSNSYYRRLTEALLHRDFDIRLEIPDDRLCPPVPNR